MSIFSNWVTGGGLAPDEMRALMSMAGYLGPTRWVEMFGGVAYPGDPYLCQALCAIHMDPIQSMAGIIGNVTGSITAALPENGRMGMAELVRSADLGRWAPPAGTMSSDWGFDALVTVGVATATLCGRTLAGGRGATMVAGSVAGAAFDTAVNMVFTDFPQFGAFGTGLMKSTMYGCFNEEAPLIIPANAGAAAGLLQNAAVTGKFNLLGLVAT